MKPITYSLVTKTDKLTYYTQSSLNYFEDCQMKMIIYLLPLSLSLSLSSPLPLLVFLSLHPSRSLFNRFQAPTRRGRVSAVNRPTPEQLAKAREDMTHRLAQVK